MNQAANLALFACKRAKPSHQLKDLIKRSIDELGNHVSYTKFTEVAPFRFAWAIRVNLRKFFEAFRIL